LRTLFPTGERGVRDKSHGAILKLFANKSLEDANRGRREDKEGNEDEEKFDLFIALLKRVRGTMLIDPQSEEMAKMEKEGEEEGEEHRTKSVEQKRVIESRFPKTTNREE
jgi:hypothetical protein